MPARDYYCRNHDSPSLLNVPKEILRLQNIHVIGSKTDCPEDEVLVLDNESGKPEIIVCAVPYLRDRDVRTVEAGESIDDKTLRLLDGIRTHYHEVCTVADLRRSQLGMHIPLIVMGHLYTEGGLVTEDDGVREHYIGNLVRIRADTFLPGIDYLALGHLHMPQCVAGNASWRYSGSPLPLGFSDAKQQKKVIVVEFDDQKKSSVREIPVPCFQEMEQITGTCDEIESRLCSLKAKDKPIWIEIILDDPTVIPGIRDKIATLTKGTKLVVLDIKNNRLTDQILKQVAADESLDQLTETDIFNRCLDAHKIEPGERTELLALFEEIMAELKTGDVPPGESL